MDHFVGMKSSAFTRAKALILILITLGVLLCGTDRLSAEVSYLALNRNRLQLYFRVGEEYFPLEKRAFVLQKIPASALGSGRFDLFEKQIDEDGTETFNRFLDVAIDPEVPSQTILLYRTFARPREYKIFVVLTDLESIPPQHALILNYTPFEVAVHAGEGAESIESLSSVLIPYQDKKFTASFRFVSQVSGEWSEPVLQSVNVLEGMRLLVVVAYEKTDVGGYVFNPIFIRMSSN
ncbi:hypothetical protein [Puniceicoccus vermicola]|uniref:Uncharacterized protein n=1 Tax=Puniceicoccus vermicola TaxID=388746 RepID=A0A7X1B1M9_9BACT|nr:hypothetical protein [Puniceicoccus vermicola]MBC2603974.1 hypothetical protein [Puniceicoccus vermicola]